MVARVGSNPTPLVMAIAARRSQSPIQCAESAYIMNDQGKTIEVIR